MNHLHRLALATAAAALLGGIVVACTNAQPEVSASGSSSTTTGGSACANPDEGCPCEEGQTTVCSQKVTGDDHYVWCSEGARTCLGGRWSACVTNGETSIHALPASSASELHVLALGVSGRCASRDGGIDPCDPYCNLFNDNAGGLDAGSGFTNRDGGILVRGCGDGVKNGAEECDDGNLVSGDGCTNACLLEVGWQCPVAGAACTRTTCGDNVQQGQEQCDDGNLRPFDGCSPTCQKEPVCPNGACVAVCGDGLKFDSEACDDGNVQSGDGCSSTCTIETNASCSVVQAALPASINVPTIYRDFAAYNASGALASYKHPDFEQYNCGTKTGLVSTTLAADGKPTLANGQGCITSATSFNQWYHDDPINRVFFGSLTLTKQADDSYLYSSTSFFPLDTLGFGNYGTTGHNFHFTSELRYPFTYRAASGGTLNFTGDDDVWVFIAGKLAVDIGGVHGATNGSVTLNTATATTLGLVDGRSYEIDVFQAERHTSASNYKLTLRGFEQARSFCTIPSDRTFVRDFKAACDPGSKVVWQAFRWRASVPAGNIAFRAATAGTVAGLPAVPGAAPLSVPIGTATTANSPVSANPLWVSETAGTPAAPVAVETHLKVDGSTTSKAYLRVFMTFTPSGLSPILYDWQQLYDCVPNE